MQVVKYDKLYEHQQGTTCIQINQHFEAANSFFVTNVIRKVDRFDTKNRNDNMGTGDRIGTDFYNLWGVEVNHVNPGIVISD